MVSLHASIYEKRNTIGAGIGVSYSPKFTYGSSVGPVLMSCGPWKPIRLEIYQSRISEFQFPITLSKDLSSATVNYIAEIESPPGGATLRIALYNPQTKDSEETELVYSETLPVDCPSITGTFTIQSPQLWYPVGYGAQPLYQVTVDLYINTTLLHTRTERLAFRQTRLVQTPLEKGTTFYFEINNIPVFCGGSNWIPADNLLTRIPRRRYREWLHLLVKGNQNMLRIWGGGIYESDMLYEAADELGILIWQDLMFACGQYPAHKQFQQNVEEEVITQLKRLRKHPCIVLFAGNNEDYQVAESAKLGYDPSDKNPENWLKTRFPARYLYEKLFPELVAKYAPGVPYHPGSPWGGNNTSDPTIGDIHQWDGVLRSFACD